VREVLSRSPLECAPDSAIATRSADAATRVTGSVPEDAGVAYWMDAAVFADAGASGELRAERRRRARGGRMGRTGVRGAVRTGAPRRCAYLRRARRGRAAEGVAPMPDETPTTARQRRCRRTMFRVLLVQVVTLLLLWLLQARYHGSAERMHPINWLIIAAYLTYVVVDGVRRARGTKELEGYFLANRSLPWWAVGLSVMATQLSAVTMIGTTGQGATDGLRLIQLYFGLPLAMIILGVTLVPLLRGAGIFTAYEFLERGSTRRRAR
jgi:hypothetical protein